MDPNVQVAVVSVFATTITTLGVVAVAMINNRKEKSRAADAGVAPGLDEKDILSRILALIEENSQQDKALAKVTAERDQLKEQLRQVQAEVVLLRLGTKIDDPDGGMDV